MLSIFGVTIVVYFIKIVSGSRNFCGIFMPFLRTYGIWHPIKKKNNNNKNPSKIYNTLIYSHNYAKCHDNDLTIPDFIWMKMNDYRYVHMIQNVYLKWLFEIWLPEINTYGYLKLIPALLKGSRANNFKNFSWTWLGFYNF